MCAAFLVWRGDSWYPTSCHALWSILWNTSWHHSRETPYYCFFVRVTIFHWWIPSQRAADKDCYIFMACRKTPVTPLQMTGVNTVLCWVIDMIWWQIYAWPSAITILIFQVSKSCSISILLQSSQLCQGFLNIVKHAWTLGFLFDVWWMYRVVDSFKCAGSCTPFPEAGASDLRQTRQLQTNYKENRPGEECEAANGVVNFCCSVFIWRNIKYIFAF